MRLNKGFGICFVFVLVVALVFAGNIDNIYFKDRDSGNNLNGVRYLLYKCPNEVCNTVDSLVFDF